jgi:hypothetical protein
MKGAAKNGEQYLPTVATVWQIAGTGDFNADGQTDLIWQNTGTGQRTIWLMNGTTRISDRPLSAVATVWEIRNN